MKIKNGYPVIAIIPGQPFYISGTRGQVPYLTTHQGFTNYLKCLTVTLKICLRYICSIPPLSFRREAEPGNPEALTCSIHEHAVPYQ